MGHLRAVKLFTNRGLLSEMPMTISRAGKPSKPRIAELDANVNSSFLHRLQVVSVPLLTGDVIGEKQKMKKVYRVFL